MNTIKSFWMGWGSLCVAGGAAYYFAKKSINADRQLRWEEQKRKRAMIESLEKSGDVPSQPPSAAAMGGSASPPGSGAASSDPPPTRPAPTTDPGAQSKYEASVPYRSTKGDRFS